MNFSPDEQALIAHLARPESALQQWGFYVATLVPIAAFAGYGLVRGDMIALGMAFFALLGFLLWYLSASHRSGRILGSVCRKLMDAKAGRPDCVCGA